MLATHPSRWRPGRLCPECGWTAPPPPYCKRDSQRDVNEDSQEILGKQSIRLKISVPQQRRSLSLVMYCSSPLSHGCVRLAGHKHWRGNPGKRSFSRSQRHSGGASGFCLVALWFILSLWFGSRILLSTEKLHSHWSSRGEGKNDGESLNIGAKYN